jgi:hypothetical protein
MDQGGDPKGKRKMLSKETILRGRGKGRGTRSSQREYVPDEEQLQQQGYTIVYEGDQGTPQHLHEFDDSYLVPAEGEYVLTRPNTSLPVPLVDYSRKQREVAEAREVNTYANPRTNGIDERFWDAFHSNFYLTVLFHSKKSKIIQMHYVDFGEMAKKDEPEFDAAIEACSNFELTDIMSFRHD